ncbi:hypothetical protein ACH8KY_003174 [Salmonella enterica subsp. enterica serovar Braenderup]
MNEDEKIVNLLKAALAALESTPQHEDSNEYPSDTVRELAEKISKMASEKYPPFYDVEFL